jgi:hypothetical protein
MRIPELECQRSPAQPVENKEMGERLGPGNARAPDSA